MEIFLATSVKRLIWLVAAIHTIAWPFRLEDTLTMWTSTHVLMTVAGVPIYLIFVWFFWDVQRLKFKAAVGKVLNGEPLTPVDVEALRTEATDDKNDGVG